MLYCWLLGGILLAVVGYSVWLIIRSAWQVILNHALISTKEKNHTRLALAALWAGADANYGARTNTPDSFLADPSCCSYYDELCVALGKSLKYGLRYIDSPLIVLFRSHPKSEWEWEALPPIENLVLLEALLRYGADVNCRDWLEDTPLCFAAWWGFNDSIRILIQHGADFTVNRGAMLYSAARAGQLATVRQILDYYEDAHETIDPDMRLIHASVESGDAETLKLLIEQGLNINTRDSDGYTPLVLASCIGNLGQIRVLIDCNADPNIQTHNHMTAFDYLEEHYESREKVTSVLSLPKSARKECTSAEQYFDEVWSIMQKLRQSGAKTWKELYAESKRGSAP